MNEDIVWTRDFKSICNAPLVPVMPDALDGDHPAIQFHEHWLSMNSDNTVPQAQGIMAKAREVIEKWLMAFRKELEAGDDLYMLFLQGQSAAQMTHGMLQGQYLHEFTRSDCFDSRRALMRQTLQMSQPGFARMDINHNKSEFFAEVTAGMFPLAEGDRELVVVIPAPVSQKLRSII